nr:indolepyruvate ferredoxin oxidoreductase [Desulfobacterales bacterium]
MNSDPLNLIITGVGGQGNVLASRIIGECLIKKGLRVTIGETYGLSQRGGSVMSHVRISEKGTPGPIIPRCKAHVIVSLEPIEALRTVKIYGNRNITMIVNSRPVYPLGVIAGEITYPEPAKVRKALEELSLKLFWIPATEIAIRLGHAIMSNVVLLGALAATGLIPLERKDLLEVLPEVVPSSSKELNVTALDLGMEAVAITI